MLLRLRFSNFRSFRSEAQFSLVAGPFSELPDVVRRENGVKEGVLPVAAVYGANASGKTNLIRAFMFLAGAVSWSHRKWKPDGPIPRDPFLLNGESSREPSEIEADFVIGGVRHRYGFRMDSESVLGEWLFVYPNGKKQTWFQRERGKPMSFSNKMPGENKTIEVLTRKNSLYLSAAAQNNHDALLPVYLYLSELLFVHRDRTAYKSHTATLCARPEFRSKVARLVSMADLGISDLELVEEKQTPEFKQLAEAITTIFKIDEPQSVPEVNRQIRLLHQFGERVVPLPLGEESDGTVAYLALLGPVVDALEKGVPLFIDELDESLHPLLAIELIRLFSNPATNPRNAQLIFSTHDTNLLSTDILRRDQIWFTEKGRDASTNLFPLSDFKLRRQENLQSGYLQGRYGAIPFINSESFIAQFERIDAETERA